MLSIFKQYKWQKKHTQTSQPVRPKKELQNQKILVYFHNIITGHLSIPTKWQM